MKTFAQFPLVSASEYFRCLKCDGDSLPIHIGKYNYAVCDWCKCRWSIGYGLIRAPHLVWHSPYEMGQDIGEDWSGKTWKDFYRRNLETLLKYEPADDSDPEATFAYLFK